MRHTIAAVPPLQWLETWAVTLQVVKSMLAFMHDQATNWGDPPIFPTAGMTGIPPGSVCASIDGDADRVVFFTKR